MSGSAFHTTQQGISVSGVLHRPGTAAITAGVVLAHGAGSNASSPLLVKLCGHLADAGYLALRIDLPFRVARPKGPPFPAMAPADRAGIRAAVLALRELGAAKVIAGGHSYGGRQASMLIAEDPCADGLLLLSYPLHPPAKPAQLRTAHFPNVPIPCLFVHGTKDGFGSIEEMESAIAAIPGKTSLIPSPGSGHELKNLPLEPILEWLSRMRE